MITSRILNRRTLLNAGVAMAGAAALPALAQAYPSKPVRVVVPYAAGGTADALARLLFGKVSEELGQQFLVENRVGAGGTVGPAFVALAPADGYTILFDATAFAVNPALRGKMPYDTLNDFQPVFQMGRIPLLLVTHPSVNANSVSDIIAIAKATPGGLSWASAGVGSLQHMLLEMFARSAGITLNHVAYKGGAPAMTDLVGGHVKYYFCSTTLATPYVKNGSIRAVAHTTSGRLPTFPDLHPISDTLPGFYGAEWLGVFQRSGTPPEIVGRLSAACNKALLDPVIKERLTSLTFDARQNTPEEFTTFIRSEVKKWDQIVRVANIRMD